MMRAVNHKTSSPNVHPQLGRGRQVKNPRLYSIFFFLGVIQKDLVEIDASLVAVVNSEATPLKLESTFF